MSVQWGLGEVPGTIGMRCPVCDSARIARRMEIDPPRARLLYYPCCEPCAKAASIDEVIYTDRDRQPIPL